MTAYVRLAQREEWEAITAFGAAYSKYMSEAPGFIPRVDRLLGRPRTGSYGNG